MEDSDEEVAVYDVVDVDNIGPCVTSAVRAFRQYCGAIGADFISAETDMTEEDLCNILVAFYRDVRRKNGELYAKGSLLTLRQSLKRHFERVRGMNIIADEQFRSANESFQATVQDLEAAGSGTPVLKRPIPLEDVEKLQEVLTQDMDNPKGLQNKVFFDVLLHLSLGTQGRENLRFVTKSDFAVGVHPVSGRIFVYYVNSRREILRAGKSKMYQTHRPDCPVASYLAYTSHLHPSTDAFFQRPKSVISCDEMVWYETATVGRTALAMKMQTISSAAGISRTYSNHNLRATCLSDFQEPNCDGEETGVVGQKAERAFRTIRPVPADSSNTSRQMAGGKKRKRSASLHQVSAGDTQDPTLFHDELSPPQTVSESSEEYLKGTSGRGASESPGSSRGGHAYETSLSSPSPSGAISTVIPADISGRQRISDAVAMNDAATSVCTTNSSIVWQSADISVQSGATDFKARMVNPVPQTNSGFTRGCTNQFVCPSIPLVDDVLPVAPGAAGVKDPVHATPENANNISEPAAATYSMPQNDARDSTADPNKSFYIVSNKHGARGTVINEFHFHNCTVHIYNNSKSEQM